MLKTLPSIGLVATVSFAAATIPAFAAVSAVGEIKSTQQDKNGLIIKQFYLGCLSHAAYLVVGYVKGGIASFGKRDDLVASNVRVTPEGLAGLMKTKTPPLVVDVRNDAEWNSASIDGTVHLPLISLLEKVNTLPRDRELVILCATGNRSSTAASLLSQRGLAHVTDLAGGIEAWQKQNLPVKQAASCSKNAATCAPTDENQSKPNATSAN